MLPSPMMEPATERRNSILLPHWPLSSILCSKLGAGSLVCLAPLVKPLAASPSEQGKREGTLGQIVFPLCHSETEQMLTHQQQSALNQNSFFNINAINLKFLQKSEKSKTTFKSYPSSWSHCPLDASAVSGDFESEARF